ncbi:MAG: hypothetical protein IKZ90_09105 [Clostridiales bacterium]|nr:hypothetical protein [Clostridiales bacterium]
MEKSYFDSDAYGMDDSEYTESKARKVCIASLVLRYAVPVAIFFLTYGFIMFKFRFQTSISANVVTFPTILMFVSYILSWVLMAKVRSHRREYRFGKIIKWLYIADTLLVIFGLILQMILYTNKAGIY